MLWCRWCTVGHDDALSGAFQRHKQCPRMGWEGSTYQEEVAGMIDLGDRVVAHFEMIGSVVNDNTDCNGSKRESEVEDEVEALVRSLPRSPMTPGLGAGTAISDKRPWRRSGDKVEAEAATWVNNPEVGVAAFRCSTAPSFLMGKFLYASNMSIG